MALYALDRLQSNSPTVKQVWYANDATAVASCSELHAWWDYLFEHGKGFPLRHILFCMARGSPWVVSSEEGMPGITQ